MPRKARKFSGVDRWVELDKKLSTEIPHLTAWWLAIESFVELRLKARDDGTVLAIAKGFSSDGGPVVCFGVGYDCVLALMSIDQSIAGDNWKFDKPWQES